MCGGTLLEFGCSIRDVFGPHSDNACRFKGLGPEMEGNPAIGAYLFETYGISLMRPCRVIGLYTLTYGISDSDSGSKGKAACADERIGVGWSIW